VISLGHVCDQASARIDMLHDRVVARDVMLAKAAQLSEVSQMAKLEVRLREYLLAKWDVRAAQAARAASTKTSAKAITAAVNSVMKKWPADVKSVVSADVKRIYKLARIAGHKKATKQTKLPLAYNLPPVADDAQPAIKARTPRLAPSFDAVDAEAAEALAARQVLWLGEHYDEHVAEAIATTAREAMVEGGASRRVAGRILEERVRRELGLVTFPTGARTGAASYFEGVAANAATVARAYGQIRSFARIGITTYTIVNPHDTRTCPVCSFMDGKTFTTQQAVDQITAESSARNPDDIRNIHPWLSRERLGAISSSPGRIEGARGTRDSAALAGAGQALPPYHFKCRCAIDVDESAGSFDDLSPIDF
jgi:hypothetical protein